jgi:hypothetical protein
MLKQKDKLPHLKVPRIVAHLTDAFWVSEGPISEGVFR